MLRVNGILESQLEQSHPFHKIRKGAAELLKMMRLPTITIEEVKTKESKDAEGNKQHSNGCWMNCSQLYRHDGIDYRIEYYETIVGSGDNEKLFPMQLDFDGTSKSLQGSSTDEVFFTLFVAPQCETLPELKQYQNEISNRRMWQYTIVRKEATLKEKIAAGKEKAELEMLLYSLENDHDRLLDVCYNFNIVTEKKQDYELVEQLMNIILLKDSQGNYNREVLERFRSIVMPKTPVEGDLAEHLAFIGRLIDSGIVIPHGTANGAWYLDEAKEHMLCKFNSKTGKRDALANYFLTHKDEIPIYKEKLALLKPA